MKKLLFLLLISGNFVTAQNIHLPAFPPDTAVVLRMQSGLQQSFTGATRNLSSSLFWQTITNYGAVADSSTDCSPAIQAVIAWIKSNGGVGKIVIPPGVYHMGSKIHVPPGVVIEWEGSGNTAFAAGGGSAGGSISKLWWNTATADLIVDSSNNPTYYNFDICNNDTVPTAGAAIHTLGVGPQIIKMSIANTYYGLNLENNTYPVVFNCTFGNIVQYSIYQHNEENNDSGDGFYSDIKFNVGANNHTQAAFFMPNSGGAKIQHCKINGQYHVNGIVANMTGNTSDLIISSCSIENFTGHGIEVTVGSGVDFSNVKVSNVQISSYSTGTRGIYLDGSAGTLHRVTLTGVTITNCSAGGGVEAGSIDHLYMSNINVDSPATVSEVFINNGNLTNFWYDKNVATYNNAGLQSKQDKKNLDSLYLAGGLPQAFFHITATADTNVYYSFPGFITDIAGDPLQISVPSDVFHQGYTAGNSTIQTAGDHGYNHSAGTTLYYTNTGLSDMDASLKMYDATFSGETDIIVRYTDINNYVGIGILASDVFIFQRLAGSVTNIFDFGSNPIVTGDHVHILVKGDSATIMVNGSTLGSATFDPSLTAQTAGIGLESGQIGQPEFTNFVVTTIPNVDGGWKMLGDSTISGFGTLSSPLHVNLSTVSSKYSVDTMRARIDAAIAGGGGGGTPTFDQVTTAGNSTANAIHLTGYGATLPNMTVGDMVLQNFTSGGAFFSNNLYINGTTGIYLNNGYTAGMQFSNGGTYIFGSNTGTAGDAVTSLTYPFRADYTGIVDMGNNVATGTPTLHVTNDSVIINKVGTGTSTMPLFVWDKTTHQVDTVSQDGTTSSNIYSPTFTGVTNVSTVGGIGFEAAWTKVGVIVDVVITGTLTPTSPAVSTFTLNLPLSTTQSSDDSQIGSMSSTNSVPEYISARVTSSGSTLTVTAKPTDTFSHEFTIRFRYRTQ